MESRFSPYAVPKGPIAANVTAFKKAYADKFGGFPGMMGASTYEGVNVIAAAVETAGTTDKAKVQAALATIAVPEMIESMEGGAISFANQFRESRSNLYMEQLSWDAASQTLRPKIVWPAELQETEFQIPEWYRPGSV